MEDAATAEISRSQLWQWIHRHCYTVSGVAITVDLYEKLKREELVKIKAMLGEETYHSGRFEEAIEIFDRLVKNDTLEEFLTINAYTYLN